MKSLRYDATALGKLPWEPGVRFIRRKRDDLVLRNLHALPGGIIVDRDHCLAQNALTFAETCLRL